MFDFITQYFISSDLCWKTTTTTRCFVLSSSSHHINFIDSLSISSLDLDLVDCTIIFILEKLNLLFSLSLDYTYYLTYVFVAKWWCEDNTVQDVVVLLLIINLVPEFDFQKQKQKKDLRKRNLACNKVETEYCGSFLAYDFNGD